MGRSVALRRRSQRSAVARRTLAVGFHVVGDDKQHRTRRARKPARRPVSRVLSPCRQDGRPFLWDASRNAPHATNPSGGAGMPLPPPRKVKAAAPIRSCSRWGLPCRPCCQGRGALLPHRFALPRGSVPLARGVCFLWHCPWGRPRRRLAGTVFPWSPDFPLPLFPGTAAVQPSGRRGTWAPGGRASSGRLFRRHAGGWFVYRVRMEDMAHFPQAPAGWLDALERASALSASRSWRPVVAQIRALLDRLQ